MSKPAKAPIKAVVNGESVLIELAPEVPLLFFLRNDLALNGPKYGCGLGECGACTVLVNGQAARSCVLPVGRLDGCEITTLEGLGDRDNPDIVQQAFIEEQAAQCGYCLNGMIMTTRALLNNDTNPSDEKVRRVLKHNLCRCGTHVEILKAVKRASELAQEA
ncbi:(2Fe-2S)-binding protein [Endozoicomonas arenosclerae]|uniref:(2Fe-2S)-binding protein n=1 Tax=Endozoicomonas arenosclerae TaxID=1633495 RepID=UPI0007865093|nr:(2Fe-2S)-binding protein [Endozoicomonas arenosclerae]